MVIDNSYNRTIAANRIFSYKIGGGLVSCDPIIPVGYKFCLVVVGDFSFFYLDGQTLDQVDYRRFSKRFSFRFLVTVLRLGRAGRREIDRINFKGLPRLTHDSENDKDEDDCDDIAA